MYNTDELYKAAGIVSGIKNFAKNVAGRKDEISRLKALEQSNKNRYNFAHRGMQAINGTPISFDRSGATSIKDILGVQGKTLKARDDLFNRYYNIAGKANTKRYNAAIKYNNLEYDRDVSRTALGMGLATAGLGTYAYNKEKTAGFMANAANALKSYGKGLANDTKTVVNTMRGKNEFGLKTKQVLPAFAKKYRGEIGFAAGTGVGAAVSNFKPQNPDPVNKQASFAEKIASFKENYDYPVDYAKHMATPNHRPSNSLYLSGGLGGGAIGGVLGLAGGAIANRIGKGALIGAGLGAGLGLYSAYDTNKQRKEWNADPRMYKEHLQSEWDTEELPRHQEMERDYASTIHGNIMHSNRISSNEVISGLAAAGHASSAIRSDKDNNYRGLDATVAGIYAGDTYNAYQRRKENKSYYDKYKSLTPEQRKSLEQEIRTEWRNMDQDDRENEYWNVSEGEPSRFINAINRY